jgi:hypothetical protein
VIRTLSIAALFALSACATAQTATSPYAGAFQPMEFPKDKFPSPMAAATALIGNFPESSEGGPVLELRIANDPDGKAAFLIQATAKGFADDSISGRQWVARLASAQGGWVFVDASNRWSCYRSKPSNQWQTTSCP